MIHKLFFKKAQTGNFYPVYYAEGGKKDKELGPNQDPTDPTLWLDKILENLYN